VSSFDLSGALRRIRRRADLSQRDLARVTETAKSTIAAAESGAAGLDVRVLARAAAAADLRLALVDPKGQEVPGMASTAVRDSAGRRFPAHLDTRYGDEAWWHGPERYSRPEPWYTFDRCRDIRDRYRRRDGVPDDHQLPQPGDAPAERRAARNEAIAQQRAEERERQRGGRPVEREPWVCDCPPRCAELEDWNGPPRHTDGCPCHCDPC
jgi:transcriptional regulator with XRE-family HTH domain